MKGKERNKRRSVNAVSLFVTCLFLFLAVQFSNGGGLFASKINKITENLDKAVLGLDSNVTYSNFTDNSVYCSSIEFNTNGMAGLYKLAKLFIDAVSPKDILMAELFPQYKLEIDVDNIETSKVLQYYASLVAIVLFLVLCVVLFPLCGLCFCCCRCCGNCGAKPQPSDKKRDTCKKIFQASLLIMCGTGLLFCIVCAFGSNQQLQEGLESFPKNMNTSLQDTKTFMSSTNAHIEHLLTTNYKQFADTFNTVMENGSEIALEQLMLYANATTVSEIYIFADNLDRIRVMLESLKSETNKLRVYASQLNDALRKVKNDLRNTLEVCAITVEGCKELQAKVELLQTSIDFNSVPDVSNTLDSFNSLNISKIQAAATEGQKSLDSIKDGINSSLTTGLGEARKQINNTEVTINGTLRTVTDTINQVNTQIDDTGSPALKSAQEYINEYGKYRYYVGLTISCILLLVIVCIVLGLICGICGKRPDGYSDNCCNKGAGSQFLICAVVIMFLFGFIISVITLVSLLLGILSEKAICDPLRNPNPGEFTVIQLLDNANLNLGIDIVPSTMLTNCYQNKSIYQTFNLKSQFDLDEMKNNFNISEQLDKLDISYEIPPNFSLMDTESLKSLQSFNPDINVDKFTEELQTNFTNYNLDELANSLRTIILQLNTLTDPDESIRTSLELSLLHLTTYDEKLVSPMKELSKDLMNTATDLNEALKMGHENFTQAINFLSNEIAQAETALIDKGPDELKKIADTFKNMILDLVDGYINRVFDHVEYEIGQCGPLSLVINATLTSTCEKVLLPWNGFWFSLFWTIILYVITIVISIMLANLYQKHKPYDQYVETEYLYDAYADRGDNIPLNSRGGKRGKKKGKKTKRYEERPNLGREVARDYAAGSHPPDGRYADMAPKHWEEFPNGGPPHYQRAPTEYERPPPYYYPGSGGEQ